MIASQFLLFQADPFASSFNIAPTQPVAVIRRAIGSPGRPRQLAWMHWGLIPSWLKDRSVGGRWINARAETVAEKPLFRAALCRRRCLIPADGFYEWQDRGRGQKKQPYFIRLRDDQPFGMAGLWEVWEGADGSYIESCAVITTEANARVAPIHARMPVILPETAHELWLDVRTEDFARVVPLLQPYPAETMEAYPVGTHVNTPSNNDLECVAAIPQ